MIQQNDSTLVSIRYILSISCSARPGYKSYQDIRRHSSNLDAQSYNQINLKDPEDYSRNRKYKRPKEMLFIELLAKAKILVDLI